MKYVKLLYCYLVSLALLQPAGLLFSQPYNTHLYTTADGLPDNYIFSIKQDSYGYLWICTANGLSRFDGKRFVSYGLKNGLPSLYVDNVYEDHNHRLWIGTRKGMAELKSDSCYTYPVNDKEEIYFVSGFFEPGTGKLWATTDKGLYEFRNNSWIKIPLYPGYENTSIGRIIKNSKGIFINYQNNRLVQQKPDGSFRAILSVQTNRPYYNNLYEKNDTIYISTYSGLLYWDDNRWIARFEDTLQKKYIYTSFPDNSNRFWFGTKEDGVLVAMPNGNEVNYVHIPLSFNLVSGFTEDRDKNIWVAGFRGLLKVSPSSYRSILLPAFEKQSSTRNCIVMPSGKIIVSGDNGTLLIVNPALLPGVSPQIITTKQLKDPNDFIDYYTFDEKQRMWFTTREGRLYRLDGTELSNLTSIIVPANNSLRGIAYNKKTKLLYVCGDSVLLAGTENHLDTFFSSSTRKFIPIPYIIHIEEEKGSMLVQTLENGLLLVTGKGEIRPLNKELNLSLSIHAILKEKDNENLIWAVYQGRGISKYKWKGDNPPELLETISEKDGLPDNYVLDLVSDKEDKLWIATTKGITLMQKDQLGKWAHQDPGISESGTAVPLLFPRLSIDNNDNMWMNLENRLLVFDSKRTAITPLQTETVIEKILLNDKPTDWSLLTDSVESYRRLPVNPVLKYNQNSLSIVFNGMQFNNNAQLEYSYRLEPSDTTWSSPTASTIVSFFQLSPGIYRFEVISHIKGADWSDPAIFSFTIKKPFWETWWFRLAVIIAASSLIVFIFRYRLKQLKIRTEMRSQMQELEMKALKAQMNPHFIHNALNSIQSLIINNRSNEASHYISKFAKLLRQVLENADKNLISLDKELYSLQLYVDLEKLRMNMDIEYEEYIQDTILSSEIKIPPLILQPFVENALWHGLSNKKGHKKIRVSITEKEDWIICEIADNGIGRKKAEESYQAFPEGHISKAVNITRQRLADFNQSPGTDPISFIDLENNGEALGTTVIIRIKARYRD